MWDKVPRFRRHGTILTYKVEYKSATNNHTTIKITKATSCYLKMISLKKNTDYSITVSASTVKGYGPASKAIIVATDQDGETQWYTH